ncbi:MAG: hypothetical protein WC523_04490 [Patescibacteria group bacterium]
MDNIVPCKKCLSDFNYKNNAAGNARQLCDKCRVLADTEEIEKLKEETILEGNKYLMCAPKRQLKYDSSEIFAGHFPAFETDADKFVCAVELGSFVLHNGFGGQEENIAKFLESFHDLTYIIVFVRQLSLVQVEYTAKNKHFIHIVSKIMSVAV